MADDDIEMPCCAAWAKAQQRHTDNEMYGALLWVSGDEAIMGCELPPVNFCPWCGAKKTPEPKTQD